MAVRSDGPRCPGVDVALNARFPIFVGLRYATSSRGRGYLSFVSAFALGAMAIGVLVLIVVLSVMNGFEGEIRRRMLEVVPHATLAPVGGIEDWRALRAGARLPAGVAADPYVEGQALVGFGGAAAPAVVYGLEPKVIHDRLAAHLIAGDLEVLAPGEFGIVIGQLLARDLGVVPGDRLLLTLPELSITPAGAFPRVKRVTLAGVFRVGGQSDQGLAFMHLADAQTLYRRGPRVDGLRFTLPDPTDAAALTALAGAFPGQRVATWRDDAADLLRALRLEKAVVGLLLSVIVAVAAFNVIAALVLMVNEKRAAIGVLRSFGARRATVAAIFNVQGCALGLTGIALGAAAGSLLAVELPALVAWMEDLTGLRIFDPELFFISRLPSELRWPDLISVCLGAGLLTVLATLYPAWRAAQLDPVEAIQSAH
jgi:lipoprotein-releasing system permease protein